MVDRQPELIRQIISAISICFLSALLIVSCAHSPRTKNFTGPENIVLGYCASSGEDVFDFYGYRLRGLDEGKLPSYKCEIIKRNKTTRTGENLGVPEGYQRIIVDKEDIEVWVLEHYSPSSMKPPQKFWYLLRNIPNMGWKIIAHTYIPDKNYPSYE